MRGDFVTIAMQGDFGKPQPALVMQSDQFNEHMTVTVLPVTSTLVNAPLLRVTVEPGPESCLRKLTLPLDCVSHNRAHALTCLASHSLSNCIGLA